MGPGPCPGKFSVPGTESQIFLIHRDSPGILRPTNLGPDLSPVSRIFHKLCTPGPSPEALKVLISVPVPVPEF